MNGNAIENSKATQNEGSRAKTRVLWLLVVVALVGLVATVATSARSERLTNGSNVNPVGVRMAVEGIDGVVAEADTLRGFANTCSRKEVVRVLNSFFRKLRLRSRAVSERRGAILDGQLSKLVANQVRILDLSDKRSFREAGRYNGIRGMKIWLERGERRNVLYSPRARRFYWAPSRREIGSFAFRDYRYTRHGRRFVRRGLEGGSITSVVARRVGRGPRRGRCLITEIVMTRFMASSLYLPREEDSLDGVSEQAKVMQKAKNCVKSMAAGSSDFWQSVKLVKEDTTVHFVNEDGSLGEATGSAQIVSLASSSSSAAKKLRSLHNLAGDEKSMGMDMDKERKVVVLRDEKNNFVEIDPENCELVDVYLSDKESKAHPLAKEVKAAITLSLVTPVCVDASSMIEVDEMGSTRVASSIKIGDYVMSRRGQTKVVYIVRGKSAVMKVKLENGAVIKATTTHLVATQEGLKRMDRLRVGDLVAAVKEGKYLRVTVVEEQTYDAAVERPVLSFVTTEGEFVMEGGATVSSYSHDPVYARWVHAVSLPLRLITLAVDKMFGSAAADKCANWIVDSFGVALTPTPRLLMFIGVRS